ncbi:MAG: FAD-dependent oxidoreductase, partial [Myxococcota bacterium]
MHVGIIGGGFAGRMAAVRLRRAGHAVTVIDAQRQHVERTRLHTAAASGRGVTVPHERLLGRVGARFVHDRVTALEDGRIVGAGRVVEVDRTLVAVGSEPVRDGPGVEEHALSLGSPEEARTIHRRLARLHAGARVVVVGAGLTGLELVTEV